MRPAVQVPIGELFDNIPVLQKCQQVQKRGCAIWISFVQGFQHLASNWAADQMQLPLEGTLLHLFLAGPR